MKLLDNSKKAPDLETSNLLILFRNMVGRAGFEPATNWLKVAQLTSKRLILFNVTMCTVITSAEANSSSRDPRIRVR